MVDQFVGNRKQQIDAQPGIMALKKRVEEYLPRAQEFVKQGRQRMAEGGVEVASFTQDVAEIKQKMETGREAIKTLHTKKVNAIANVKALEKTKTWSPDQTKSAKAFLVEIVANAKNARGQLKTLDVMFEGLEKRGKAAGPGWKEMAAKAVSEASKPYKEAAAASKAFDTDEEKCKKICKDHGVTV
jgi:small-conductance mechanosensitive channel